MWIIPDKMGTEIDSKLLEFTSLKIDKMLTNSSWVLLWRLTFAIFHLVRLVPSWPWPYLAVHALDSIIGILCCVECDEAKPSWISRLFVLHQINWGRKRNAYLYLMKNQVTCTVKSSVFFYFIYVHAINLFWVPMYCRFHKFILSF